ncbi:MAG: penicillin-binding transpeptidase domain-containing protein [Actinomycetaceae bacterium]|nr:penicillin-binding transpeptidase domain-containing protein [Actinomycetaceae bacterium]MDY6082409.1 penicillin-binding transpeptidase domain-containing protein [Actinomycetaceae bacterium]
MNRPIRHVALLVIAMFLTLMVAVTSIQFFQASSLNADSRNVRTLYAEYGTQRGLIIVGGQSIAKSTPTQHGPYEYQRVYTAGSLYANMTGYFATAFNSMTGLERTENDVLGGSSSSLTGQRLQQLITGKQPQGGAIQLTIDPAVQKAAANALKGQKGAVVALDPSTGAILAQVSEPSFDPNTLATQDSAKAQKAWKQLNADPNRPLMNRAIAGDEYPPGSAFKIVTTAAMLEADPSLTTDSIVEAPTTWTPPGTSTSMTNYAGERCGDGSGKVKLSVAFAQSCNTTFAIAGVKLGGNALAEQAHKFFFSNQLSTPQSVTPSRFPLPESSAALASASIGQQDVRVTPMQMAMIAASVAHGGQMMKPYLVDRVLTADLKVASTTNPSVLTTPISGQTAQKISQLMVDAVASGTGKAASIKGVSVAGKTGTAQTGTNQAPHSWFVGFAPADNPTIALAVVVENSGKAGSRGTGGTVAAPLARQIIQASLASHKADTSQNKG